ncbi:uncharacterized protein LOC135942565 [Cloeon dipterum]|uniref:uncharacterized protein LOC135942565 n=1 Tax=Cloeon dipterum TaxID=197152 RepID=UPI00321FFB15
MRMSNNNGCSHKVCLVILLLVLIGAWGNPAKKKNAQKKMATTRPPFKLFQQIGQIFNPITWLQQQEKLISKMVADYPDDESVDSPLVAEYIDPQTGRKVRYTTGSTSIDNTVTSFFGALTQIMDNMFKTFVTPAMNGTIWDDTPRPNGSGGLSNFLSSFFCQIFLGLLSPNYNGNRCSIYKNSTVNPISG